MDENALRASLVAIRAQVDSILFHLGAPASANPGHDEKCSHPPERRRDLTVMGGPERWECGACGHIHES